MKPPSPLRTPEQQPLKPTSPLHPKTALKTPVSHPHRRSRFQLRLGRRPERRWRYQTTGPPGRQDLAAAPAGSNDTTASQISHVIYRGHFSTHPKNVAIPMMPIQCLNKPQGNYVRNWWAAAGPGRASRRRAQPPINDKHRRCRGRQRELPRCRWAVAGPGRASRRRTDQHTRNHWCGGRRRDRRARAGFEARRRTK